MRSAPILRRVRDSDRSELLSFSSGIALRPQIACLWCDGMNQGDTRSPPSPLEFLRVGRRARVPRREAQRPFESIRISNQMLAGPFGHYVLSKYSFQCSPQFEKTRGMCNSLQVPNPPSLIAQRRSANVRIFRSTRDQPTCTRRKTERRGRKYLVSVEARMCSE